jgi:spore coat protein CotH
MNFLGTDTAQYQKYYSLKSSDVDQSWEKLENACQVLSTASINTMELVSQTLDVDKILWFLAVENIFADDDSYVMKGKMDYYVYYEPETGLTFPMEYDGNSAFLAEGNQPALWRRPRTFPVLRRQRFLIFHLRLAM